jgi:hypothetical protein
VPLAEPGTRSASGTEGLAMSRQLFSSDVSLSEVDLRIRRLEERVARLEAALRRAAAPPAEDQRAPESRV